MKPEYADDWYRLKQTCSYPMLDSESQTQGARPSLVPQWQELSCPNIRDTLHSQISAIVGDGQQVLDWAAVYFRTIHPWLPVISQTPFSKRLLPARLASESADFCLLTLAMYLVCTNPVNGELPSQARSLYLLLKSLVSMLEAVGISSIEMLQGRLLVTIFEVGHGLYPAAYISSGANVRAAIDLGVNAASSDQLLKILGSQERAEEAQRTWNGIIVADRYATLERAKGTTHNMEPFSEKSVNTSEAEDNLVLTQTDPLIELTQASQILVQALAHINGATSNHAFTALQALQILKAATSFLATCSDRNPAQNAVFSSAVAFCRSAMLEMLEHGSRLQQSSIEYCDIAASNMLQTLVNEIVQAAASTGCSPTLVQVGALPVFIPHCIYKAAMLYLQLPGQSGQRVTEPTIRPLTDLLRLIGTRWIAARNYLEEIEKLGTISTAVS